VRFGRKPSLTQHQRQEALARKAAGEALVSYLIAVLVPWDFGDQTCANKTCTKYEWLTA
jgi:hypothetical protein